LLDKSIKTSEGVVSLDALDLSGNRYIPQQWRSNFPGWMGYIMEGEPWRELWDDNDSRNIVKSLKSELSLKSREMGEDKSLEKSEQEISSTLLLSPLTKGIETKLKIVEVPSKLSSSPPAKQPQQQLHVVEAVVTEGSSSSNSGSEDGVYERVWRYLNEPSHTSNVTALQAHLDVLGVYGTEELSYLERDDLMQIKELLKEELRESFQQLLEGCW
jgi:hypothetical protein